MSRYDSPDLLAKLKALLKLPPVTEQTSDVQLYEYLTQAQEFWFEKLAARFPDTLYGPWVKLTTADNGKTYSFGIDPVTNEPVFPLGHFELRAAPNGELLFPGTPWDEGRYVLTGNVISWANDKTRTFANGPWARFVKMPAVISAVSAPSLQPPHARMVLVARAAVLFAEEGGLRDPAPYEKKEAEAAKALFESLATQAYGQGATAVPADSGRWWDNIDDRPENYTRYTSG